MFYVLSLRPDCPKWRFMVFAKQVKDFVYISDNAYTREQILSMVRERFTYMQDVSVVYAQAKCFSLIF
jgi:hypothetical protein